MAGRQSIAARATCHLPIDITTDILLRLPVKSLLRCKSVCKIWYDLIKSPHFIAKHLQTQSTLNSTSLLVTTCNYGTKKHDMSIIFNNGFNSIGHIDLNFPFLNWGWESTEENYFSVVGICNGLVCISLSPSGFSLVLCNPSTRQFQQIPNPKWNWVDGNFVDKRVCFGFGFHPSANDYKLIRICYYTFGKYPIVADLYAMSTNTWMKIDVNKLSLFFGEMNEWAGYAWVESDKMVLINGSSASAVLNGVFYWPARVVATGQVIVMSFDMGNELFRRIKIPECLDRIRHKTDWQFVELNDKFALVVTPYESIDRVIDVWVLSEDGNSWTTQVKVGSFTRIASIMGNWKDGVNEVVGCGKNGELLVIEHKFSGELKLFSYDTKTQETMDLNFSQVPYVSHVKLYAGSLLPVMQANEIVLKN